MYFGSVTQSKTTLREKMDLILEQPPFYQFVRFNFRSIPKEGENRKYDPEFVNHLIQEGCALGTRGNSKEALEHFTQALEIARALYTGNH